MHFWFGNVVFQAMTISVSTFGELSHSECFLCFQRVADPYRLKSPMPQARLSEANRQKIRTLL